MKTSRIFSRIMKHRHFWLIGPLLLLAAITVAAGILIPGDTKHAVPSLAALSSELTPFKVSDPPPACEQARRHMPATRDREAYRLYYEATKVWRSKSAIYLTREEAGDIRAGIQQAAIKGDWGALELLAYFYHHGLGGSGIVLDRDDDKALEIYRMAAAAGLPWGFYELGEAYRSGDHGISDDKNIAGAYYLKAAQLGSPDAQMSLAFLYAEAGRFDAAESMNQCAYRQGHGRAAETLGAHSEAKGDYKEAVKYLHSGVKFGCRECADSLFLLFDGKTNPTGSRIVLDAIGAKVDPERAKRYRALSDALNNSKDLKFSRLDQVLPLPPAKLPQWHGVADAIEPESSEPPHY